MSSEKKIKKKNQMIIYGIFLGMPSIKKAMGLFKEHGLNYSDISVILHGSEEEAVASTDWLNGAEALNIPNLGAFIVAGPIKMSMVGEGIKEGLIGLGIPEYEVIRYEDQIKKGGMLISTFTEDAELALKAKIIFEECKGSDISTIEILAEPDMKSKSYEERCESENLRP